ncbi:MAG: PD-(D/E)XK nuclease family protein, partial [Coriobacteriales bacterium]
PPQERFIRTVASIGGDVVVALTYEDGHPATASARPWVQRLAALPGTDRVIVSATHTPSADVKYIERHLFREEMPHHHDFRGDVVLSVGEGRSGEAQRIAREVQDLVETGIPWGEIAVVFRVPENHEDHLRRAFSEAAIPAYFDTMRPVVRSGLGRALALLLSFFAQGMPRVGLIGFLRSGYSGAEPDECDEFDRVLRSKRIERGREVLASARNLGPCVGELLRQASSLCAHVVSPEDLNDWKNLLDTMLASAYPDGSTLDEHGLFDAASRRVIVEMLEELSLEHATLTELVELLGELTVTVGRRADDAVQVMSAERARSLRFEAVILGGLEAGEFPSLQRDDALDIGAIGEELKAAGIDMSPRTDQDAERLLFYQVVTGARRKLVLSHAACDDDGKPVAESQFLREFEDLYRDPVTDALRGTPPVERRLTLAELTEAQDAPSTERRQLRAQAAEGASTPVVKRARRRLSRRGNGLSQNALDSLATRTVFSVSEIEHYVRCPYQWFYADHLRAEALDEPIDMRTRGTLAHRILTRFYEDWLSSGYVRVDAATLGKALEVHQRVAQEVLGEATRPRTLQEEEQHHAALRASEKMIRRDAEYLPGFVPLAHEWTFGAGDESPEDLGGFELRGRIDRIDVSEGRLVVADYKTSQVYPRARFAIDGVVQIPLYARVASRRLSLAIAGGLYRSMGNAGDRGFYLKGLESARLVRTDACTPEEVDDLIDGAVERAKQAVAGIRLGKIPAEPLSNDVCTYCAARPVCRRAR